MSASDDHHGDVRVLYTVSDSDVDADAGADAGDVVVTDSDGGNPRVAKRIRVGGESPVAPASSSSSSSSPGPPPPAAGAASAVHALEVEHAAASAASRLTRAELQEMEQLVQERVATEAAFQSTRLPIGKPTPGSRLRHYLATARPDDSDAAIAAIRHIQALRNELAGLTSRIHRLAVRIAETTEDSYAERVVRMFRHEGLLLRRVKDIDETSAPFELNPPAGRLLSTSYIREGLHAGTYYRTGIFGYLYDPHLLAIYHAFALDCESRPSEAPGGMSKKLDVPGARGDKYKRHAFRFSMTDYGRFDAYAQAVYGVPLPDTTVAGIGFKAAQRPHTIRAAWFPRADPVTTSFSEVLVGPLPGRTVGDAIIGIVACTNGTVEDFIDPELPGWMKADADAHIKPNLPMFLYSERADTMTRVMSLPGYTGVLGGRRRVLATAPWGNGNA